MLTLISFLEIVCLHYHLAIIGNYKVYSDVAELGAGNRLDTLQVLSIIIVYCGTVSTVLFSDKLLVKKREKSRLQETLFLK